MACDGCPHTSRRVATVEGSVACTVPRHDTDPFDAVVPGPLIPYNRILAHDAYNHGSWMAYSGGWTPGMAPHIIDLPVWALDLDVPLVQYLPYFQMDDERCRLITIRQMLSHTSGMPDMEDIEYVELVSHPEHDDDAAERFVRGLSNRRLVAEPGERFSYSNIAYNVLGNMIAKVSGKSFEAYMQECILIPSGMSHSTFMPADIPTNLLTWPHLRMPDMGSIMSIRITGQTRQPVSYTPQLWIYAIGVSPH